MVIFPTYDEKAGERGCRGRDTSQYSNQCCEAGAASLEPEPQLSVATAVPVPTMVFTLNGYKTMAKNGFSIYI
jgi:hypothetical protein